MTHMPLEADNWLNTGAMHIQLLQLFILS